MSLCSDPVPGQSSQANAVVEARLKRLIRQMILGSVHIPAQVRKIYVDGVDALHGTYAGVACGYRSQLVKNSLNIRGMQLGCDVYAGAHKYLHPIEN